MTVGQKQLCLQSTNLSNGLARRLEFVARLSAITSDVIVIATTWYYNGSAYRKAWKLNSGANLGTLVLRDGTLYFLCILLINTLQTYLETSRPSPPVTGSYSVVLLVLIPSVLISRFLLNLREVSSGASDGFEESEDMDTIAWASDLSSLQAASTSGGHHYTSNELQDLQRSRLARDEENVHEADVRDISRWGKGPNILNLDDFSA